MFLTNCRVVALAVLGSACVLTACDDAPPAPTATPGAPKAVASTKAQVSSDMVAAVSSGKTATAVGVHFALGSAPIVGKALPVKIAIVPHQEFGVVRAHFEGPEGLAVTAGDNFGPSNNVAAEKTLQHELVLLPAREGVFMLSVSVDTYGGDGNITRIFSIPVIVNPAEGTAPTPPGAETANTSPATPPST
jgi:hypothetical protein